MNIWQTLIMSAWVIGIALNILFPEPPNPPEAVDGFIPVRRELMELA